MQRICLVFTFLSLSVTLIACTPQAERLNAVAALPSSALTATLTPAPPSRVPATPAPTNTETSTPMPTAMPSPTPIAPSKGDKFAVVLDKLSGDIYSINQDTGTKLNLTEGLSGRKWTAPWAVSPDQQWVLVGHDTDQQITYRSGPASITLLGVEIWLIKTDGTFRKNLFIGTIQSVTSAVWSPDSKHYLSPCPYRDVTTGLCFVSVQSENDIKVTHTGYIGYTPSVSPDGSHFVWLGVPFAVWITDGEKWTPRKIAQWSTGANYSTLSPVAWSADGQSLDVILGSPEKSVLYNVQVNGAGVTKLAEFDGHAGQYHLVTSSDNRKLVFWQESPSSIYPQVTVVDFDGANPVSFDTKDVYKPKDSNKVGGFDVGSTSFDWSSDSQSVFIRYFSPEESVEYELDLRTGKFTPVKH